MPLAVTSRPYCSSNRVIAITVLARERLAHVVQLTRDMMLHKLAIVALIALPTTALAQPGSEPAEKEIPPPHTASEAPRGRLSHINGVPIKVGEHNEYYYEIKRWNVSSNPIGWMLGSYGLSVSYAASAHVAVRGDVNFYAPVGADQTGYELGIGVPIYFRRTYQGPFLEPGLMVRHFSDNDNDYDYSSTEMGPQVLAGWHWTWDSGLNIAFAFGAGRNISRCDSSCDDYYDERDEPFVNGYMRFGYAF